MTVYVILQRVQPLRLNWELIVPPNARVIVLHSPGGIELPGDCMGLRAVQVPDYTLGNIVELLRTIARDEAVECSAIRLCTNDEYCLELCGSIRQAPRLPGPGPEAYLPFIDKLVMKQRLLHAAIRAPRFAPFDPAGFDRCPEQYIDDLCRSLGVPLVVKPTRGANNQSVRVLSSTQEVHQWCRIRNTSVAFQFEEYIKGTMYHCNAIIRGGKRQVIQVGEYLCPCLEFSRGQAIGSITLEEHDEMLQRIRLLNDRVLDALCPPGPCVTHLEVFHTPNDDLVFLEVAARAPGAMVSEMCRRHTGIHLLELSLRLQMGAADDEPRISKGPHCGWAWYPCRRGTVGQLNEPKLRCESRVHWNAAAGTHYTQDGDRAVCEVLFWHQNRRCVQQDAEYLRHWEPTAMSEVALEGAF